MLHEKIKIVRKLSDEEIAKRREEKALQEQKNNEKLAKKSTKNFEEKKFKKNNEHFEKKDFKKTEKKFEKKSEKSENGKQIFLKKEGNFSENRKNFLEKNSQKKSKI